MRSPADILADFVSLPNGWTKYIGNLPGEPNQVVAFMDAGGPPSNPRWLLDFPTVQVMVRGEKDSYGEAYAQLRAVRDKLLGVLSQDVVETDGTHRLVAITELTNIMTLGNDANDRPMLSWNCRTIWEPPSGDNREPL